MRTANALLFAQIISQLLGQATAVKTLFDKAEEEGRDVTPDEANAARDRAVKSVESL